MVSIELLIDHPETIPQLVQWFEAEWAPYYGPDGPGVAKTDLRESANRDELPIALVSLQDGQVCGTAALKIESVTTHSHLSPWLAALLVGPEYRDQGISRLLIAAVEDLAREMGFKELYCGTDSEYANIVLPGWTFIEKTPYFVSDADIYRSVL